MITLDRNTVRDCNSSYRILLHAYNLYNPHPGELSVETLMKICSNDLGKKIVYEYANDTAHLTRVKAAFFAKEDGSYAICLQSDLNNCWHRMVLAKELFHVIFDHPEYVTTDLEHHVESTISVAPNFNEASPPSEQLEFMAEYAAMEFLLPYTYRIDIVSSGTTIDFDLVAEQFKVPRAYVEQYLSNDFMALCASLVAI